MSWIHLWDHESWVEPRFLLRAFICLSPRITNIHQISRKPVFKFTKASLLCLSTQELYEGKNEWGFGIDISKTCSPWWDIFPNSSLVLQSVYNFFYTHTHTNSGIWCFWNPARGRTLNISQVVITEETGSHWGWGSVGHFMINLSKPQELDLYK